MPAPNASIRPSSSQPDPNALIDQKFGQYKDSVDTLSETQKFANMALPRAPDPQPFGNKRAASGSR